MIKRFFIVILFVLPLIGSAQLAVSTYCGNGTPGFTNGNLQNSTFNGPFGICRDSQGNLFIADAKNNCIRKINTLGVVSTYAGSGQAGYLDGPDSLARFKEPTGVCTDNNGNVFVADFLNHRIRKIDTSGLVSTIAGMGVAGYLDGQGINALFNYPRGITADVYGNIFVGDSWNHRIRKIDTSGYVTTYAGSGSSIGVGSIGALVDGTGQQARFYTPCGLSIDSAGNIYIADAYNHRIRIIDPAGIVSTIAGSGASGNGNGGYANGPALQARLNTPTEVFVTKKGDVLIGDTFNNRIRKMKDGYVSTLAGSGLAGFDNGLDTMATFNYPRGITANEVGDSIFVIDYNNHSIRLIFDSLLSHVPEIFTSIPLPTMHIFPNPAMEYVNVLVKNSGSESFIDIIDITGKNIKNIRIIHGTPSQISLSEIPAGIYFMKLFDSKNHIVNKLIIER